MPACLYCVCGRASLRTCAQRARGRGRASVCARARPALSPSSLPVISLPQSSAAAPRLRPESNQDSHLYPACHPRGCWAGGVRGCRALLLPAEASPKSEDLAVWWGGSPGLPPCSQLLAPPGRRSEKALVAMRKIFRWSIPIPHKKNLLHIIHIFQCNYPQPTHTAWRIKT